MIASSKNILETRITLIKENEFFSIIDNFRSPISLEREGENWKLLKKIIKIVF